MFFWVFLTCQTSSASSYLLPAVEYPWVTPGWCICCHRCFQQTQWVPVWQNHWCPAPWSPGLSGGSSTTAQTGYTKRHTTEFISVTSVSLYHGRIFSAQNEKAVLLFIILNGRLWALFLLFLLFLFLSLISLFTFLCSCSVVLRFVAFFCLRKTVIGIIILTYNNTKKK